MPNLNDPIARFERQVLEVLVQVPDSFTAEQVVRIVRDGFSSSAHNAILEAIGSSIAAKSSADYLNAIITACEPELHGLLRSIAAQAMPAKNHDDLVRYGQGVIARALVNALAHSKAELMAALRRDGIDGEESARIQRELVELEAERRKLQGS
jgi:DNA primase